jgi:hypothetical protein
MYPCVGSEVFTEVVMKISVVSDIRPCSSLKSTDVPEEHVASFIAEE